VSHELRVERVIEASAAVVFDAFTDADAQRVWMRDTDDDPDAILETRCDPRVGGFPTAEIRDYFAATAWQGVLDALDRFVRGQAAGSPKGERA
jgi:uncharacterized protein YndB with AHSA1/START domain